MFGLHPKWPNIHLAVLGGFIDLMRLFTQIDARFGPVDAAGSVDVKKPAPTRKLIAVIPALRQRTVIMLMSKKRENKVPTQGATAKTHE